MAFLLLLLFAFQSPNIAIEQNQYINFFKVSKFSSKPIQKYKWANPPKIRVCETAEVPLSRVRRAVDYWERIGYEFGEIYLDRFSFCMNAKDNEIAIVLPSQGLGDDKMAATRVYTSKLTGEIIKAKIFIYPRSARKERVLEHELGHALGWQHYNHRNHMMHPNWWRGGYDSYGLRK
tara:strand:- start:4886 stop:5416 length:531 start_codon:yes stop_codon:yes gene_type:complete